MTMNNEVQALSDERRAKIEAAIKETEYKYFGDYQFSEAQHDAVDVLVDAARDLLSHTAPQAEPKPRFPTAEEYLNARNAAASKDWMNGFTACRNAAIKASGESPAQDDELTKLRKEIAELREAGRKVIASEMERTAEIIQLRDEQLSAAASPVSAPAVGEQAKAFEAWLCKGAPEDTYVMSAQDGWNAACAWIALTRPEPAAPAQDGETAKCEQDSRSVFIRITRSTLRAQLSTARAATWAEAIEAAAKVCEDHDRHNTYGIDDGFKSHAETTIAIRALQCPEQPAEAPKAPCPRCGNHHDVCPYPASATAKEIRASESVAAKMRARAEPAAQSAMSHVCPHCHYDHTVGPICKTAARERAAQSADKDAAEVVESIIRDVCEMDPANPELNDTICIDVSDLLNIVKRHVAALAQQAGKEQSE